MKINRAYPLLVPIALIAGCQAVPPPSPPPSTPRVVSRPAPYPTPTVRPAPVPAQPSRALPPASPARGDWRDAPYTAGGWRYQPEGNGTSARFIEPSGAVLATLRCDRAGRTVTLSRAGDARTAVPASITTSTGIGQFSAAPATQGGMAAVAITFAASDRQLDAMAFSRGRFMMEVSGLPTLVLPAWAEVGKVIEDCR